MAVQRFLGHLGIGAVEILPEELEAESGLY
jgi:hypothetical protein